MTGGTVSGELVADYRALDFPALWRGRDLTTMVEGTAVRDLLEGDDPRRRMELGTGGGRLTDTIRGGAREFVGVDLHPEFIGPVSRTVGPRPEVRFVAANVYHLPLAPGSITSAVSVRMFNFLSAPAEALQELHRVIVPGGQLVLTVHHHPSLGSWVDDLKMTTPERRRPGYRPRTFRRDSPAPVEPAAFPSWSWTRPAFRRLARTAGWSVLEERATGLEDFRMGRLLDGRMHRGLLRIRPILGLRPTWFLRLKREGAAGGDALPALGSSWCCPRCGRPIPGGVPQGSACVGCSLPWSAADTWNDLRYVPGSLDPAPTSIPHGAISGSSS